MIAKDNIWMRRAMAALYGEADDVQQPIGQKGQKPPIASGSDPIGAIVPIGQLSRLEIEPGGADEAATADFEERAGIAEYDGGLSRLHAETLAALSTAPGDIDPNARAKVIDFAARHLEHMNRVRRLEGE